MRFLLIVIFIAALILNSCQETTVTKEEVAAKLDTLEHKFEWLDYRISQEQWDLYTRGFSDSLEFYTGLYNYTITDKELLRNLNLGKKYFNDEDNLRRYDLIYSSVLTGLIESENNISALRDSLNKFDIIYRPNYNGEKTTQSSLYDLYRSSDNQLVREQSYRAWTQIGNELADGLEQLFRLRNQQARTLGYNNYFALVFSQMEVDQPTYLKLLDRLDSLSRKPYQSILQGIRTQLRYDDVEIWDITYAYKDINRKIDSYFPVDFQLDMVKSSLEKLGYDLDQLPIYFDLEAREGKSQFAYAFPIKPPYDVRVLANLTNGLYSTRVLMHEMGHALHATQISQERALYTNSIASAWGEGMAQLIAAQCDEKDWLQNEANVPADVADEYNKAKKEQDLVYLRTTLCRLMFEYEAYQNPNQDLNKLYWELFEKYLFLPRHDDLKPWASLIYYITHPVYMQNYLFADIITAQSLNSIKRLYGYYSGNSLAGSFLTHNYFRFGSRYSWREMLKRGTDEDFNPDYLIEQLGI